MTLHLLHWISLYMKKILFSLYQCRVPCKNTRSLTGRICHTSHMKLSMFHRDALWNFKRQKNAFIIGRLSCEEAEQVPRGRCSPLPRPPWSPRPGWSETWAARDGGGSASRERSATPLSRRRSSRRQSWRSPGCRTPAAIARIGGMIKGELIVITTGGRILIFNTCHETLPLRRLAGKSNEKLLKYTCNPIISWRSKKNKKQRK